ncbi:MAG: type III pantothenate kinase [Candidatus Omnitrophica bacterium]|nr:type III pantothenate kinase [Candidatus Omnitrophota bacterium]
MKLLIDIGNTNTSIAVCDRGKIKKRYFIHTAKKQLKARSMVRLLGKDGSLITNVLIVSVVPKFLTLLEKSLGKALKDVTVKVVGRDVRIPIVNRYSRPREVGKDRLVTAFAAAELYGAPVLVLDFGTALTLDYVSEKREYKGGMIFPGLRLSLGSLVSHTALLPKIEIGPIKGHLIGKSTKDSMNKGLVMGYGALCDGLIARFRREYGNAFKVVATGGDSRLISRVSTGIQKVDMDLMFKGLNLLSKS